MFGRKETWTGERDPSKKERHGTLHDLCLPLLVEGPWAGSGISDTTILVVSLHVLGLPSVRVGRELLGGWVEGLWKVTVVLGCRKIMNYFKLWCWRRLLRVPWTTRRSNQSILKEISPEYSLEGLMKLKLQYFAT